MTQRGYSLVFEITFTGQAVERRKGKSIRVYGRERTEKARGKSQWTFKLIGKGGV